MKNHYQTSVKSVVETGSYDKASEYVNQVASILAGNRSRRWNDYSGKQGRFSLLEDTLNHVNSEIISSIRESEDAKNNLQLLYDSLLNHKYSHQKDSVRHTDAIRSIESILSSVNKPNIDDYANSSEQKPEGDVIIVNGDIAGIQIPGSIMNSEPYSTESCIASYTATAQKKRDHSWAKSQVL